MGKEKIYLEQLNLEDNKKIDIIREYWGYSEDNTEYMFRLLEMSEYREVPIFIKTKLSLFFDGEYTENIQEITKKINETYNWILKTSEGQLILLRYNLRKLFDAIMQPFADLFLKIFNLNL